MSCEFYVDGTDENPRERLVRYDEFGLDSLLHGRLRVWGQ